MKPLTCIITALLILITLPGISFSENRFNLKFEHLSEEQGLSHPMVSVIIQDRQGFMWFGTDDGLNKYDGNKFVVYKNEPDNINSLSDNSITAVYESRKGSLWIGTHFKGLNRFDPETETFTRYENDKNNPNSLGHNHISNKSLYEDKKGILWIGTNGGGLQKFDPVTGVFIRYKSDPANSSSLSNNNILCIYPFEQTGELWIGTPDGLNRFNPETETFTRFTSDPANPKNLFRGSGAIDIYAPPSGDVIWAGTTDGLLKLDLITQTSKYCTNENSNFSSLKYSVIYSIYPDDDKTLWLGTSGGGLYHFDPANETCAYNLHNENDLSSLSNDYVMSVFKDRSGILWVGTLDGINRSALENTKFNHYRFRKYDRHSLNAPVVNSICAGSGNIIWIGTENGGLNKFEPDSETFSFYTHEPDNSNSLSNDKIWSIYEDRQNIVWTGTSGGGLNSFDPETGIFTNYQYIPNTPGSLSDNYVRDIVEDNKGNLWIGTSNNGLNMLDRDTGKFTQYHPEPKNPGSLSSYEILKIMKDSTGRLWLATGNGIDRFDPEVLEQTDLDQTKNGNSQSVHFTHFRHDNNNPHSLSTNQVFYIYEDSKGNIWAATNAGLNKLDSFTGRFIHYTEKHGLPDNRIQNMIEDYYENLWIGTAKGISRFNLNTETFKNYEKEDGLQGDFFNYQAIAKDFRGYIYFGGNNGFNLFRPEQVKGNQHIPQIVLTDFRLFNEPVPLGKDSPLKKHINFTKEIILPYNKTFIAIEFSALNYMLPEKNQYSYILDGYDKNRTQADSSQRIARYNNISPGEYCFNVTGSNNDGLWNPKGASVKITVMPPWWHTIWFRTLMAGLLSALFFGAYQWRMYEIKQRNLILKKEVEERTRDLKQSEEELRRAMIIAETANRAKSEFLANVSHEIRTPMNAILGFAEIMLSKTKDLQHQNYLNTILSAGQSLLVIINDILDLSKIEAGRLELQYEPVPIKTLLWEIKNFFMPKAMEKDLEFSYMLSPEIPEVLKFDDVRVRQILINLINNAIKFTHKGYIKLSAWGQIVPPALTDKDKSQYYFDLTFEIEDTGIGIDHEQQDKIFEMFKQQDGQKTRHYGGTGLGLSITKRLIKMMGGKISVKSKSGKGSIFIVNIPGLEVISDYNMCKTDTYNPDIEFVPATIMIVDDIEHNRTLVKEYLGNTLFDMFEAENAGQALKLLESGCKPDLIFMDLKMPGMNGYELTRIIKKDARFKHIPVVAMTASAMKKNDKNIKNFFDGYLTKPLNMASLKKELKKFLAYKIIESEEPLNNDKKPPFSMIISDKAKEHMPEILNIMDKEIIPEWKNIKEVFFIDDITNFSLKLKNIAQKYDMPFLLDFSSDVYEYTQNFDVDGMEKSMNEFSKIINRLKAEEPV